MGSSTNLCFTGFYLPLHNSQLIFILIFPELLIWNLMLTWAFAKWFGLRFSYLKFNLVKKRTKSVLWYEKKRIPDNLRNLLAHTHKFRCKLKAVWIPKPPWNKCLGTQFRNRSRKKFLLISFTFNKFFSHKCFRELQSLRKARIRLISD